MIPKDFLLGGIHCGIAKKFQKKDLALLYSKKPAKAYGMFTSNLCKAAPVLVSQKHLKMNKTNVRGIIANSGCANACTGLKGFKNAEEMCGLAGKSLGVKKENFLVASTGVIGKHLPIEKISKGIKILSGKIGFSKKDELSCVQAIMTTDTFTKISSGSFKIGNKKINIWGCVKGAGMIHPDLKKPHATMLSFILTDANISNKAVEKALSNSIEKSFNCVSVDGDTSTNDSVFLLANGAAGNSLIAESGKAFDIFSKNLLKVCLDLAKKLARDGEGATKLIEIEVNGARDKNGAKKIASTIATSPLFKTAIFGNDANWGRIMAAAGRSGVSFKPEKVDVWIGNVCVAKKGIGANFSEEKTKRILHNKEIKITVNLNSGKESAKYYTCDFSFDYVKINASYRS
ncbi:MAG: bifunctional glutamate N-acetyltransferase/amino-acid acetyltransferase ArgJ [Elusimicrobia bacterium]|nr:bifunctional glutamate N-acetyltransferase/amino-acid acetyltransferase ArgJ [Elusimicrobiota bacterium]